MDPAPPPQQDDSDDEISSLGSGMSEISMEKKSKLSNQGLRPGTSGGGVSSGGGGKGVRRAGSASSAKGEGGQAWDKARLLEWLMAVRVQGTFPDGAAVADEERKCVQWAYKKLLVGRLCLFTSLVSLASSSAAVIVL